MKKNYLSLVSSLLLATLLMTACQKSRTDATVGSTQPVNLPDAKLGNKCQLTYSIDWGGLPNWFSYNNKGLVDEWHLEFAPGVGYTMHMRYDDNNRLSTAQVLFNSLPVADIEFIWTGNRITRERANFGGFESETVNVYNARGQIVKRESSDGIRVSYQYSPEGNHLSDTVYFGNDPLQSDEYGYDQPNKSPYLAIQGLPYQFLFYNPNLSQWYATSNKFTIYDNGQPIVISDLDPSKTVMQMTHQHYLSSAVYFDKELGDYISKNFEYQNCGAANRASTGTSNAIPPNFYSAIKTSAKRLPLLRGQPGGIQKQIEELKKQYLNKQ